MTTGYVNDLREFGVETGWNGCGKVIETISIDPHLRDRRPQAACRETGYSRFGRRT
jgi:hypothetical protein